MIQILSNMELHSNLNPAQVAPNHVLKHKLCKTAPRNQLYVADDAASMNEELVTHSDIHYS